MGIFHQDIIQIKEAGLYRKLKKIDSFAGTRVLVDGKELLMMASNDYLGYCSHPAIKQAAQKAVHTWGAGSGAARLISGNAAIFRDLEKKISRLKGTEDALVFSTGYMANIGLLSAVAEKEDIIYSDALNHASIVDGCRLSRARVEIFPHGDTGALETLLKNGKKFRRRFIITDGVFSMDGDLAPLPRLAELARSYCAQLIVDDAHGTGVLGHRGGGTIEYFGLEGQIDIIMGTMGKALGCFGAFVAGSSELRDYLINRARTFIYTTALPPAMIAGAIAAIELLEKEPQTRQALQDNISFFRRGLQDLGFNIAASTTQIIPVLVGDTQTAIRLAGDLMEEGLFIQAIRPPTVAEGSARLRITLMATHTKDDLTRALEILGRAGKRYNLI
jgi:8-amino-7-oxononanoate synthase